MKKTLTCLLMLLACCLPMEAFHDMKLLERLDSVMADCEKYIERREAALDSLKAKAAATRKDSLRLKIYDEIYALYYTYRFDSAMVYVNRSAELAARIGNKHYSAQASIHRSVLLSTSGLYGEALDNFATIAEDSLCDELLFDFYFAYAWTYNYLIDYCADNVYAPRYRELKTSYLQKALPFAPNRRVKEYVTGVCLDNSGDYDKAYDHYTQCLDGLPVNTRLYAMATHAIARYHLRRGNMPEYERWLVKAAISDITCPLKENLAIQELSMYLFRDNPNEINRAHRYINFSMNDARFYHNRLRIVEIGDKLPDIADAYQRQIKRQSDHLKVALACISLLVVGLVILLCLLRKQLRLSHTLRRELAQGNERLRELNERLRDTNTVREGYVRLFLDLCAAYIDKLAKYRNFVQRKIKAKQAEDLLKSSNSTRLTEQEAMEFFVSFDMAFLELYPDFITQFNNLLREDARIVPKKKGSLTTDLRIFALIRLGVRDSSEISTLLFYSPQTIYNYRSAMKGNALNRETFEEDVAKLCTVL